MRIKDIILDILNETKLFEMAFERKIAIQHARNIQHEISRHLIKVCMYHDSEYVNHWCNELNGWLWSIQKKELKSTRKPLDSITLMKILFEEPMETVSEVQRDMNRIYKEYGNVKIDEPNAAVVHKNVYDAISSICDDISQYNFDDVRKYLL